MTRIIFDHIRKTGGQSLNQYISKNIGNHWVTPNLDGMHHDLISKYGGQFSVISAHLEFASGGLDPRYKYVTILRDPVERVISWICFTKNILTKNDPDSEVLKQIIDFLKSDGEIIGGLLLNQLENHQTRHFQSCITDDASLDNDSLDIAKSVLRNYSLILKTNDLVNSVLAIQEFFGFQEIFPMNKVNVRYKKDVLSDKILTKIQTLNELDILLYNSTTAKKNMNTNNFLPKYSIRQYNKSFFSKFDFPYPVRANWSGNYSLRFYPYDSIIESNTIIIFSDEGLSFLDAGNYNLSISGIASNFEHCVFVISLNGNSFSYEAQIDSEFKFNASLYIDKIKGNSFEFKVIDLNKDTKIEIRSILFIALSKVEQFRNRDLDVIQKECGLLADVESISILSSDLRNTDVGKINCGIIETTYSEGVVLRKQCNLKKGYYKLYLFGDSEASCVHKAYIIIKDESADRTHIKRKIITSVYFDDIFSNGMISKPIEFELSEDIFDVDMVMSVSSLAEFSLRDIYLVSLPSKNFEISNSLEHLAEFFVGSVILCEGNEIAQNQLLTFELPFSVTRPIQELEMGIHIFDANKKCAFETNSTLLKQVQQDVEAGEYRVFHRIIANLPVGNYTAGFAFAEHTESGVNELYWTDVACEFRVNRAQTATSVGYADFPATINLVRDSK